MEDIFDDNKIKKSDILLSDLKGINKNILEDYFNNNKDDYYSYLYHKEKKQKTKEDIKEIVEKKNKLKKESFELYNKKNAQKIKELESAFNQMKLEVKFNAKAKFLRDGIIYTLSKNGFTMYDNKIFNKLLEIKFPPLKIPISVIQLENNDLVCAFSGCEILIYRLTGKEYFEYQNIKDNGLGFIAKYGNHGFCGNTAYKVIYIINELKAISKNRFICISNYGLKIYSLNENNKYSLVLLNEHLNDVEIIHEINENKFIFCTNKNLSDTYKRDKQIIIEMAELNKISKNELDDKLIKLNNRGYHLKSRRFVFLMNYDDVINGNEKNISNDKLQEFIESLKLTFSFKTIIKYEEFSKYYHLSNYIIIKKKYFVVMINNNIFVIDIINGIMVKRYEIFIDLILDGNNSLFIYSLMNIQKWNNNKDNEFIIFIDKNIILFELNEEKSNEINLKILSNAYFPNIKDDVVFKKLSEKQNKFYSYKKDNWFISEKSNNISIY